MKPSVIIIILLMALTFVLPLSPLNSSHALNQDQTFQAVAFWGTANSLIVASPGSSDLPLTIQVFNLGPSTVTGLSISFISNYPLVPTTGEATNLSTYLPLSQPGTSVSMLGYYSVFKNASQGVYKETLFVKYNLGTTAYSQNVTFTLAILGPPPVPQTFQAVAFWGSASTPVIATPGSKDLPLQLMVYNTGPDIVFNTSVTFTALKPLIPVEGQTKLSSFIPLFRPGSSLILSGFFDILPNISTGMYGQLATISYSNGTKYFSTNVSIQIAITGYSSIQLSSYNYIPATIYPGYPSAQLQVALLNTGNTPAFDVNVSLYTSYPARPLYPGSNVKFLGLLPVGQPVLVQIPPEYNQHNK